MVYEVRVGDSLEEIKHIPDESIDSVITSPPYYLLRDYKHDKQIGLEDTPEEYISKMVSLFSEIKRVLKPTGTVWLNIGDTYDSNKSLLMIPAKLALGLREDGWIIRQDIIWYKPCPMPEGVKDRCTKSHEHIFLLTKQKDYYFDAEANRVQSTDSHRGRRGKMTKRNKKESQMKDRIWNEEYTESSTRNRHDVWIQRPIPYPEAHFAVYPPDLIEPCVLVGCPEGGVILDPFAGSGTTAGVAEKHGRNSVMIELNEDFAKLIPKRVLDISQIKETEKYEEWV